MKNLFLGITGFIAIATGAIAAQSPSVIPNNYLSLGLTGAANKTFEFNLSAPGASTNPKIRWNNSSSELEFSNDGTTFDAFGSGGGGGTPGGSNFQIQYNNSGSFGGIVLGPVGSVMVSAGPSASPYFTATPSPSAGGVTSFNTRTGAITLLSSDVPTLNQNTTGSAQSFTGSLNGDVTGNQGTTNVSGINGTNLSTLATGLIFNTTGTGIPSVISSAGAPGRALVTTSGTPAFQATPTPATFAGLSPQTTKGDLITFGSSPARHAVPNDYGWVIPDSGASDNWRTAPYNATEGKPGKNYIQYADFENGATTGWSLGTVGALTNGIPSGSPTFGSGASGNLSIAATTSNVLAGSTSLALVSSAATTVGNMLASSAYTIDAEDRASVLSFRFSYNVPSGGANGNFSGTSSNSFGVAIWDATNSQWVNSTSNFGMACISAIRCTVAGTFQPDITTASIRFIIYNANATAGAITVNADSVYTGPQFNQIGVPVTDPVPYTPTFTGWGTVTGISAQSYRIGPYLYVEGGFISGTVTATEARMTIGYGGANGNVSTSSSGNSLQLAGKMNSQFSATTDFSGATVLEEPSKNYVTFGQENSIASGFSKQNGTVFGNNGGWSFFFKVPIAGWSSNTVVSNDAATNVVAMQVNGNPTATLSATASLLKFTGTVLQDTNAGFSTTTGLYTCPVTGFYKVQESLNISGTFSNNGYLALFLALDGTLASSNLVVTAAVNTNENATLNYTIFCPAGHTLAPWAQTNATSPAPAVAFSGQNFFTVERVSGPTTIAASESVVASYLFVGATGLPSGTIENLTSTYATYTKIKDNFSAFSNGVFTAPISGSYLVVLRGSMVAVTSNVGTMALVVNQTGSASTSVGAQELFGSSSQTVSANAGQIFNIAAGDTLLFQALQVNTSTVPFVNSNQYNGIYITRIGN